MKHPNPKSGLKYFARLGYSSRGVIYLVVGALALLTASGFDGETTNSKGALKIIHDQPFGEVLLAILVLGLIGYSTWRSVQAVSDSDNHGMSVKGLVIRGGLFVSGITHAFLAYWAFQALVKSMSGGESGSVFDWFSGAWLQAAMCIAGLSVAVVGGAHIYKGWTQGFQQYLDIPREHLTWAVPTCRFGLVARGVVWCILGYLFLEAAYESRSEDSATMGNALSVVHGHGAWLLIIIAVGLFAFGVYGLLEAKYRRISA